MENLQGFDSGWGVVIVSNGAANRDFGLEILTAVTVDFEYVIPDESICSIMEKDSRMVGDIDDFI